jgi:hypothetical protein
MSSSSPLSYTSTSVFDESMLASNQLFEASCETWVIKARESKAEEVFRAGQKGCFVNCHCESLCQVSRLKSGRG